MSFEKVHCQAELGNEAEVSHVVPDLWRHVFADDLRRAVHDQDVDAQRIHAAGGEVIIGPTDPARRLPCFFPAAR
jgi:hypothetical protein